MTTYAKSVRDPVPESAHAFAETRDLNSDDQFLRRMGYRIHARPKRGEALWLSPAGVIVPRGAAVAKLRAALEEA